ncbi:MAG: AI-2E family transporter [Candidatus Dormibacteraeota bacterium]|nr:AI-2E family transporter [Candidatus Dormibacteraeota bacterium]
MSVHTLVVAALIVLSVVALALLLRTLSSSVLVILLAIVFAEGIRPLVDRLQRRGLSQPLGILAVYVALAAVLAGVVALLVTPVATQAESVARNLPSYEKQLVSAIDSVAAQLHLSVNVSQQVGQVLGGLQSALVGVGSTIVAVAVNFVLVLVIGFLWLVTSARLKAFVVDLLPVNGQQTASDVLGEMGLRVGGYLRAMSINGVVVGVATGLVAALLRLPAPALLGVFTGVVALIPVVGAVLGVVVPALAALTFSPTYALIVVAVMAVVQIVDANTVVPLVVNRVVSVPALLVVISLTVGGALAGVIGALLAVPIAAAGQVLVLRVVVPAVHRAEGRATNDEPSGSAPVAEGVR